MTAPTLYRNLKPTVTRTFCEHPVNNWDSFEGTGSRQQPRQRQNRNGCLVPGVNVGVRLRDGWGPGTDDGVEGGDDCSHIVRADALQGRYAGRVGQELWKGPVSSGASAQPRGQADPLSASEHRGIQCRSAQIPTLANHYSMF